MSWTHVKDGLPADETPVLIVIKEKIRIGELRWEYPTFEETFRAYQYWDDPEHDGQDWDWKDVTHWTPLPAAPDSEQPA